jgi:membrane-associated protease RseP (regulator of RpoE activity)
MPSKSAKYNSLALAQAKKALGKFSGQLASPILFSDSPGLAGPLFVQRAISAERSAKLELLLTHYRVHPNDKDRWIKLSACLAADFVPGMIAVKVPAEQLRERRNREWTVAQYSELVRDVDVIRSTIGARKIYRATSQLIHEKPEKWGAFSASSLVTRYHEGKRMTKRLAKLTASARPLWKPAKDLE